MGSRLVRPDTVRLHISDGDWLLVKRRLTAGDQRRLNARMVKKITIDQAAGRASPTEIEIDPEQVGISTILAYLLDWSLPDMPIRGEGLDVVTATLDGLDQDSYDEILAAVTAHEATMNAERAQEKKLRSGVPVSSATSILPSDVTGHTSTLPN